MTGVERVLDEQNESLNSTPQRVKGKEVLIKIDKQTIEKQAVRSREGGRFCHTLVRHNIVQGRERQRDVSLSKVRKGETRVFKEISAAVMRVRQPRRLISVCLCHTGRLGAVGCNEKRRRREHIG